MAKKAKIPNKHIHARVAFLHQAAALLTVQHAQAKADADAAESNDASIVAEKSGARDTPASLIALRLNADLQDVSRKLTLRMSRDLKRSICNTCKTSLIPGSTSHTYVENKSRGGRKSCADVLIIECLACGSTKRLPVGSRKQASKAERKKSATEEAAEVIAQAPVDVQRILDETQDSGNGCPDDVTIVLPVPMDTS